MALLTVRNLKVAFPGGEDRPVVNGIDLEVERGTVLGIVGETGAGKTLTTRAILRAVRDGIVSADEISFEGIDLLNASHKELRTLRGNRIGVIVQDARNALNPMQPVGTSLIHILRAHTEIGRKEAKQRVLEMFDSVGLPDPESVYRRYPHELSGGMAQRVVIAATLSTDPELIIADEATTGLDLTVQAQILDLLKAEIARRNAAAIIVTHDFGIVAHYCTEVAVLYAGKVRERGTVAEVFAVPAHPYTAALLASTARPVAERGPDTPPPRFDTACEYVSRCLFAEEICTSGPIPLQREGHHQSLCRLPLESRSAPVSALVADAAQAPPLRERGGPLIVASELRKTFRRAGGESVHAVNDVTIDVRPGETVALVGESGSGKSTLGRLLLRLIEADRGSVTYAGTDITRESKREFRKRRTDIQAVFQDPGSSLDSRMRAVDIVSEPIAIFSPQIGRAERRSEGLRLMQSVGLGPELAERYPRQLSGGQQQRLAIARAIATKPRLIVLDEPTASLDMSVRGQVLGLLRELQQEHDLAYLLISHDLRTVRQLSERVVVMYLGEIVEQGPTDEIFTRPRHPYTRALLSPPLVPDPSVPPEHVPLEGEIPKPTDLPDGCYLATRCPLAIPACSAAHPVLEAISEHHAARCIRLNQT